MTTRSYRSPEGRLKAVRLHPRRWRFGYEDRGDWISLEESSYHVGPLEFVVARDTFITSRPNWRRWSVWPEA
jgi:hypothetical protein